MKKRKPRPRTLGIVETVKLRRGIHNRAKASTEAPYKRKLEYQVNLPWEMRVSVRDGKVSRHVSRVSSLWLLCAPSARTRKYSTPLDHAEEHTGARYDWKWEKLDVSVNFFFAEVCSTITHPYVLHCRTWLMRGLKGSTLVHRNSLFHLLTFPASELRKRCLIKHS